MSATHTPPSKPKRWQQKPPGPSTERDHANHTPHPCKNAGKEQRATHAVSEQSNEGAKLHVHPLETILSVHLTPVPPKAHLTAQMARRTPPACATRRPTPGQHARNAAHKSWAPKPSQRIRPEDPKKGPALNLTQPETTKWESALKKQPQSKGAALRQHTSKPREARQSWHEATWKQRECAGEQVKPTECRCARTPPH